MNNLRIKLLEDKKLSLLKVIQKKTMQVATLTIEIEDTEKQIEEIEQELNKEKYI